MPGHLAKILGHHLVTADEEVYAYAAAITDAHSGLIILAAVLLQVRRTKQRQHQV